MLASIFPSSAKHNCVFSHPEKKGRSAKTQQTMALPASSAMK
jgi:hypothetical protein